MKAKLTELMARYGKLAAVVYVTLCVLSFGLAYLLLRAGLQDLLPAWLLEYVPAEGTAAVGAYAIYKGLMPPRIAFALVITPVIARWLGRAPTPTEAA